MCHFGLFQGNGLIKQLSFERGYLVVDARLLRAVVGSCLILFRDLKGRLVNASTDLRRGLAIRLLAQQRREVGPRMVRLDSGLVYLIDEISHIWAVWCGDHVDELAKGVDSRQRRTERRVRLNTNGVDCRIGHVERIG